MRMSFNNVLAFLCFLSLNIHTSAAFAQHSSRPFYVEQAQQRFFDEWPDARTLSLAGASIGTANDSSSVNGNPAGLGFLNFPELTLSYDYNQTGAREALVEYQHVGTASLAIPSETFGLDWGTFGIGTTGLQGGPNDYPINSEHRVESFDFAYAKSITPSLSIGYTGTRFDNHVYSNLYRYEMNPGIRHTVGAQYKVESIVLGASTFYGSGRYDANFHELGESSSSIREFGIDVGASYATNASKYFAGFELSDYRASGTPDVAPSSIELGGKEVGSLYVPKIAAEFSINDWLTARIGTRYIFRRQFFYRDELSMLSGEANSFAWSTGLGAKLPLKYSPEIDLGYEERELESGNRQIVATVRLPLRS